MKYLKQHEQCVFSLFYFTNTSTQLFVVKSKGKVFISEAVVYCGGTSGNYYKDIYIYREREREKDKDR